jgi:hypothetical protein
MQMNIMVLVVALLGAQVAVGCKTSSPATPARDAGAKDTGTDAASVTHADGSAGTGGEIGVTCLGSAMCDTGMICCGNMAKMSTSCASSCPAGDTQLCKAAAECTQGGACRNLKVMGISFGVCLGGGAGTGGAGGGGAGGTSGGDDAGAPDAGP